MCIENSTRQRNHDEDHLQEDLCGPDRIYHFFFHIVRLPLDSIIQTTRRSHMGQQSTFCATHRRCKGTDTERVYDLSCVRNFLIVYRTTRWARVFVYQCFARNVPIEPVFPNALWLYHVIRGTCRYCRLLDGPKLRRGTIITELLFVISGRYTIV